MDITTKKLIEALQQKRQAEGYSLRKLSTVTGVSFSSLARMERGEGEPDHNSRIRILEWLGEDAEALGLPFERVAHVHFRASKNIDSKTIHCLLQVATVLEHAYGVRRTTGSLPINTPLPEGSPVILSKPDMEEMARDFRKELGLDDQKPFNPLKIMIEGVSILTIRQIDGITPEVAGHLEGPGATTWSAMSVPVDEEKEIWVIVCNEKHQLVRQHVSLLEEFWHILLGHKLTRIAKVADVYGRTFDEHEEHDAYYLAAATLLPETVIRNAVHEKKDGKQLAKDYGTSPELIEYRIKRLGLWREYRGKNVHLETS
jgi:Zn-dependent peptidase ImmA (M78 family)/transcriptional regulator with XRE-family HTH domain